jgi:hypothetical protein
MKAGRLGGREGKNISEFKHVNHHLAAQVQK